MTALATLLKTPTVQAIETLCNRPNATIDKTALYAFLTSDEIANDTDSEDLDYIIHSAVMLFVELLSPNDSLTNVNVEYAVEILLRNAYMFDSIVVCCEDAVNCLRDKVGVLPQDTAILIIESTLRTADYLIM